MGDELALVKTLDFQLDIQSDNEGLLHDACLESRSVYNETIRLTKQGVDWDAIPDRVADDADLVKNTTQRVVAKALDAMKNYYEYDDFGQPSHTKDSVYPLRANYEEGYNLSLTTPTHCLRTETDYCGREVASVGVETGSTPSARNPTISVVGGGQTESLIL